MDDVQDARELYHTHHAHHHLRLYTTPSIPPLDLILQGDCCGYECI